MGLFGVISTASSGLTAHAESIETSAGNLANSQTLGFKRKDAHFIDYWPESGNNHQHAGGVGFKTRGTNTIQGDIISSEIKTHVAINGDGYFIVDEKVSNNYDGSTIFSGNDKYTRRGDFSLNKEGYLVNGAGSHLKGLLIDPSTRSVIGTATEIIQIDSAFLEPLATTEIEYRLNLPTEPKTIYSSQNDDVNLLQPGDFTANPATATYGGTGSVSADDATRFLEQSVSGGSVTAYTSAGARANVQLRWTKIDSATTGASDAWNLFYMTDSTATGTDEQWQNVGQDFVFGSDGKLDPQIKTFDLTGVSVDGVTVGDIEFRLGENGLTQFADTDGTPQVNIIRQNGYPAGELVEARIVGNKVTIDYSNGEYREVAQIALAAFSGDNFLESEDGGTFTVTQESGTPVLGGLGKLVTQSLENSNVEMSEEFGKISKDQMGYVSNSRVSSVAIDLMRETLNILN